MRVRTFIAVAATPAVRKQAIKVASLLRPMAGDVKWVLPENLHWTLQFLGDVDEDDIPEVWAGVSNAMQDFEPFVIAVRGAGAFPSNDRPRTLWLGAGDGAEEMIAVQGAIQTSLGKLGYRGEHRRYVPHLTLGRAGRNTPSGELAAELTRLADHEAGAMLVEEIGIYSSILTREGPTYEPLGHVPFAI